MQIDNIEHLISKFETQKKQHDVYFEKFQNNKSCVHSLQFLIKPKSLISKMPKLLILKNVTQYQSEDDINKQGSTCQAMRSLIFSPMGFKVITMIKQRNLASYVQTNILDQVSMSLKTTENRVSIGGISGNRAELEQYQKVIFCLIKILVITKKSLRLKVLKKTKVLSCKLRGVSRNFYHRSRNRMKRFLKVSRKMLRD